MIGGGILLYYCTHLRVWPPEMSYDSQQPTPLRTFPFDRVRSSPDHPTYQHATPTDPLHTSTQHAHPSEPDRPVPLGVPSRKGKTCVSAVLDMVRARRRGAAWPVPTIDCVVTGVWERSACRECVGIGNGIGAGGAGACVAGGGAENRVLGLGAEKGF
jgi:hypothetical protein